MPDAIILQHPVDELLFLKGQEAKRIVKQSQEWLVVQYT
eukprot:CAMPEP_0197481724 /NCGR_PEP_ID=MMETSP1309-20131121/49273_1 /TAXON_ID=464262 /ORGANISM="Genus nov. species nov., Strain RCC998" /LENGTH=38 /DNA_ID= /DNA_START= /DNA_END= /DNA_ORIENTATION=